jgi:hypothetical protein
MGVGLFGLHPLCKYPRKEKHRMQIMIKSVFGLARPKRVLGLAYVLAVLLLVSLAAPHASAKRISTSFEATYESPFLS